MLLDLLKPDKGPVTLDGIDPSKSEEWKPFTAANPEYMIFKLDDAGNVASGMGPLLPR